MIVPPKWCMTSLHAYNYSECHTRRIRKLSVRHSVLRAKKALLPLCRPHDIVERGTFVGHDVPAGPDQVCQICWRLGRDLRPLILHHHAYENVSETLV